MAETPEDLKSQPEPQAPAEAPAEVQATADAAGAAARPRLSERLAGAKGVLGRLLKGGLLLIEKFGLYLFMGLLPLVLVGYPATLLVQDVWKLEGLSHVEATLTGMDINKVADGETGTFPFKSKGRTDVTLMFRGADGHRYQVVVERPWVAPGLRKQLEARYGDRESFMLFLDPGGTALLDEQVASKRMVSLSLLMALVLLASVLALFLRHRLADRLPTLVSHESAALARSIIYAQLIALLVAFVFTFVIHHTPVVVTTALFMGLYWGGAFLLGLSLRLLVFQNPPPPPPEPEAEPRERGLR